MAKNKSEKELLEDISKQLDRLTAILLIKSGLTKEETAKSLGVTGRTIQNWVPIKKIRGGQSE